MPVLPEPVLPEPVLPEPVLPDPVEPEPVEPDPEVVLLDELTAFVMATPDGEIACQMPPSPCPFTWPTFLSPA